jgi:hypothetical protein
MHYLWWKARLPGSCSQCASHSSDRPAMGAHCQKSCIMPTVNSYVFENIPYVCKSIIFFDQWLTISFISESVTEIQNRYIFTSTSSFPMQYPNSIHMTRILLLLKSLMTKCILVQSNNRQYFFISYSNRAKANYKEHFELKKNITKITTEIYAS